MSAPTPQNGSNRVLVIDDDLPVQQLLVRMLTTRGCLADGAINGEDGLVKVRQREYHAVITDIKMPKMDGFQFIQGLKAVDPEIPVIIATAVGDVQNAVKAIRLGAYDFIHKPFGNPDVIWQPVQRAIELRRMRRQNNEYQRHIEEINKQLTQELNIARTVQRSYAANSLLPDDRYETAGIYEPCFDVGGDLYGAFPIGDRHFAAYMADVSGHGPAAALLTAMIKVHLDSIRERKELFGLVTTPHEIINDLNRILVNCAGTRLFVTMFYGVADAERRTLTYCSAGHCPPILRRAGEQKVVYLDQSKGIPMATGFDFTYHDATVEFRPGDLLMLYTDGIIEASNAAEERLGRTRLAQVIESSPQSDPPQLIRSVSRLVRDFIGGSGLDDDVALLIARRKP